MRLRALKLGRVAYPEIRSLAAMYEERLRPFAKVESHELKDETGADRLLPGPAGEHPVIALDERGKELTSKELAARLQKYIDDPGVKSLTFVVGGPMGLSDEIKGRASLTLSLARGTLTSDIAWLVLWEQLYRAFNILKGTGYHHE